MANHSDPHVLDQPWRIWATIAVVGILLGGILLGVIIIPIVQGRAAGIDAYTAICRAMGILPGSPAQRQPVDRTPPTPVSQVVWTPASSNGPTGVVPGPRSTSGMSAANSAAYFRMAATFPAPQR
jgi:hypothetical protein